MWYLVYMFEWSYTKKLMQIKKINTKTVRIKDWAPNASPFSVILNFWSYIRSFFSISQMRASFTIGICEHKYDKMSITSSASSASWVLFFLFDYKWNHIHVFPYNRFKNHEMLTKTPIKYSPPANIIELASAQLKKIRPELWCKIRQTWIFNCW